MMPYNKILITLTHTKEIFHKYISAIVGDLHAICMFVAGV